MDFVSVVKTLRTSKNFVAASRKSWGNRFTIELDNNGNVKRRKTNESTFVYYEIPHDDIVAEDWTLLSKEDLSSFR